jgi:hypothetical protein
VIATSGSCKQDQDCDYHPSFQQIAFVDTESGNSVNDAYLTQSGWMSPAQLYESPFTDFSPRGVEGVFDSVQVTQLLSILDSIRQVAAV